MLEIKINDTEIRLQQGDLTALDIEYARGFGYTLKLLAIGKRCGDRIEARVHPTMVPDDYPLAAINGHMEIDRGPKTNLI